MRTPLLAIVLVACAEPEAPETTPPTIPPACGDDRIDEGEACDGLRLDDQTCRDIDAQFVGGTLTCDEACAFDTTSCATASDWIRAVRDADEGPQQTFPIARAVVTQVRPALGADPDLFFVQAEAAGPALRIEVPLDTLEPAPAVGDTTSFVVREVATTAIGLQYVPIVDAWSVDGSGADVVALAQDSTGMDPGSLESELVTASGTIAPSSGFAGAEHVLFELDDGLVRAPAALADTLDLTPGCDVTIRGIAELTATGELQVGIVGEDEITSALCPPPGVVEASWLSDTAIEVFFDRRIDAESLDASDFAFDTGLTTIGATLDGPRTVRLETTSQGALTHTLTVADVVDLQGSPVDPDRDTVVVFRADFEERLYLSEVDASTGPDALAPEEQFVEVWNNTAATIDFAAESWFLVFINGNLTNDRVYRTLQLEGTLDPGERLVAGEPAVPNADIPIDFFVQTSLGGVLLVRCDECLDRFDIPITTNVGTEEVFVVRDGKVATKFDAVGYGSQLDEDMQARLGVDVQYVEGNPPTSWDVSITRISNAAWAIEPPSPGEP